MCIRSLNHNSYYTSLSNSCIGLNGKTYTKIKQKYVKDYNYRYKYPEGFFFKPNNEKTYLRISMCDNFTWTTLKKLFL